MKQLEIQVQQLQEELNTTKAENFEKSFTAASTVVNSVHTSPLGTHFHQTPIMPTNSQAVINQIELLKTNEKFLKEKIEGLKFDLSRKETEFQQLKTKYKRLKTTNTTKQY